MCKAEDVPLKTMGMELLVNFPGRQVLSQLVAGGIKCILCDSPGRRFFPTDGEQSHEDGTDHQ